MVPYLLRTITWPLHGLGHTVSNAFHLFNPATGRQFSRDDEHLDTVVDHAVNEPLSDEGFARTDLPLKQVQRTVWQP